MLFQTCKKLISGKNRTPKNDKNISQTKSNAVTGNSQIFNINSNEKNISKTESNTVTDDSLIFTISPNAFNPNHNLPEILVTINGHKLPCLLDLGSSTTVINTSTELKNSLEINNSSVKLKCANGSFLPVHGESNVLIYILPNLSIETTAIIAPSLSHSVILGCDSIEKLQYDRSSNSVFLNGIEVPRYRPYRKPAPLKTCNNIELPPHSLNNEIEVRNPVFGIFDAKDVFAEKFDFRRPRKMLFSIENTVKRNEKTFKINVSNNSGKTVFIKRNTRVGRVSPIHDNINEICGLSNVENFEAEKQDIVDFQQNRKQKYDLEGKLPKVDLGTLTPDRKQELSEILIENNLAFQHNKDDLGKIGFYRFTVPLFDENAEIYQPPRPIPPGLIEPVKNEFNKWQENDLVEEADSPINIPLLIIRKPDKSVRLALDARKLNSHSIRDRFPMPSITSMMSNIGQRLATSEEPFISTFDACRAYNQLMLKDSDRNKVAFSLFNRHWRSKRLLYGLANGPSAFCRLMSKLFADDDEISVFIDDICIISPNWESHKKAIDRMLKICISTGLVLDVNKTQISQEEVRFLGETLTKTGRKPSNKHVEALKKYPVPTCRKSLKTFLGMAVFEMKFVRNSSVILEPLHKLSSPKRDFIWEPKHQLAFDNFIKSLIESTGLNHRNPTYPLILTTDASGESAGAVLSQLNNDNNYEPLGFFSRAFNEVEKRHSSRHREAYAIHDAIKHFEFELLGQNFLLETDHASLVWLCKERLSSNLNMRMINVYHYLAGFEFEIKYVPNTSPQIKCADALSRINLSQIEADLKADTVHHDLFSIEFLPSKIWENNRQNRVINLISQQGGKYEENFDINALQKQDILFQFEEKTFTESQFISLQKSDKFCSSILNKIACNCRERKKNRKRKRACVKCKKAKKFSIENGLLYNIANTRKRLVIPDSISTDFVRYCHVSYLHPGAKALSFQISRSVFVHNLHPFCRQICKSCFECARAGKITLEPATSYPFEHANLDLIDYGKADKNRKKYLLVFNCQFSDFIDGVPIPNKRDSEVSKHILELFLRHGIPNSITTDNGREFGPILNAICKQLGVQQIKISPYNSRANRCERSNRCIRIKQRLLNLQKSCWSQAWPFVRFSLNNTPKAKLDMKTPFECAYGRSIFCPYTLSTEINEISEPWVKTASKFFNELYPEIVKFQYNRGKKICQSEGNKLPEIGKNSIVLIFRPHINNDGKVGSYWSGPCKIVRPLNNNSYLVRCTRTNKTYRRHRRHLRVLGPQRNQNLDSFEHSVDQNIETQEANYEANYLDHIQPDLEY